MCVDANKSDNLLAGRVFFNLVEITLKARRRCRFLICKCKFHGSLDVFLFYLLFGGISIYY